MKHLLTKNILEIDLDNKTSVLKNRSDLSEYMVELV